MEFFIAIKPPTAGAVLAGISRKERSDRRKARRRRNARARKQAAAVHMETESCCSDAINDSELVKADIRSCSQVAETDVEDHQESTITNPKYSREASDEDEDKGGCDGTI